MAVGMFGKGTGWSISVSGASPLTTLGFAHRITDGGLAARFAVWLKDSIESGYGLGNFMVEQEQAVASGTSKRSE